MERKDIAVGVIVIMLTTLGPRYPHVLFYPQPPTGVTFAQVSTSSGGANYFAGIAPILEPTTLT